jgi:hypothetical protein
MRPQKPFNRKRNDSCTPIGQQSSSSAQPKDSSPCSRAWGPSRSFHSSRPRTEPPGHRSERILCRPNRPHRDVSLARAGHPGPEHPTPAGGLGSAQEAREGCRRFPATAVRIMAPKRPQHARGLAQHSLEGSGSAQDGCVGCLGIAHRDDAETESVLAVPHPHILPVTPGII